MTPEAKHGLDVYEPVGEKRSSRQDLTQRSWLEQSLDGNLKCIKSLTQHYILAIIIAPGIKLPPSRSRIFMCWVVPYYMYIHH